jgi:hypothetical protein
MAAHAWDRGSQRETSGECPLVFRPRSSVGMCVVEGAHDTLAALHRSAARFSVSTRRLGLSSWGGPEKSHPVAHNLRG